MFVYNEKLCVFQSTLFNSGLMGFGTKNAVNSVIKNDIAEYFEKIVPGYDQIIKPLQTHSTNIVFIDEAYKQTFEIIQNTDGIITQKTNTVLTIQTADCVPIIFFDEKNEMIGISHNGWKGTYENLSQKMVHQFLSLGSKIENIKIAIGPSINVCCYEIYGDRFDMFNRNYQKFAEQIFLKNKEKVYLNIQYLNFLQLRESGILPSAIEHFPFCTSCDQNRFDSYHRDHNLDHEMISFIVL